MTKVGDSVDGKYDIIDLLGEGGMSRVWLARDKRLNKLWAVKEIGRTAKDANNAVVIQSLIAEANLMKQLDHPALPRIVDIIETDQTTYVVMDYIEGESLNRTMRRLGRPMAATDVIEWGIQLCDALEYLHTRTPPVIYRDMKPGNIMLRDDGTVKLIDFGIAREYKEHKSSDTQILGTQGYAAPEQFSRTAQSDARTDIYSLGVTLYHLVTGRSPLDDPVIRPIRQINPQLPEGLEYIISKATQQDPDARYQTCALMRSDLEIYERLTKEYREVQEAKLLRFRLLRTAAVACAVIGLVLAFTSVYFKNSTYENYMMLGASASVNEVNGEASEAERNYTLAIGVEPSEIAPYDAIINDVYKADQNFTITEAQRWVSLYGDHQRDIEGSGSYARLCYDVGSLYFIYFEQEDMDVGRTYELSGGMQAAQWFDRAMQSYTARTEGGQACEGFGESDYRAAGTYKVIGEFYQRLSQATLEGHEGDVYGGFWESLEEGLANLTDDDPIMVKLRLYELAYQEIASPTHLNGFRRVGVERFAAEDMLDKVIEATRLLEDDAKSSEKAAAMYGAIVSGETEARANIERIYGNAAANAASMASESSVTNASE